MIWRHGKLLMSKKDPQINEYKLPKAKSKTVLQEAKFASGNIKMPFFGTVKKNHALPIMIAVLLVIVLLTSTTINILRDSYRVKLTKVTVTHEQVPASFDGFKILQISDVYGKEFGENQSKIKALLEDVEYDIVIMTGDYLADSDDTDFWAIRDLLNCLDRSKPIYYIVGDNDYTPSNVSEDSDRWKMCIVPAKKTEFMQFLEDEYGAIFIYPAQKITNEAGDSIYLTSITYDRETLASLDFDKDEDFSICVTHKPINYNVTSRLKDLNRRVLTEVDYDLSISGHTLGGQYRIPILGAVYWSEAGWFPQESDVKGLSTDSSGRYNFICSGLGTKSGIRINDTPEIALIELKTTEAK